MPKEIIEIDQNKTADLEETGVDSPNVVLNVRADIKNAIVPESTPSVKVLGGIGTFKFKDEPLSVMIDGHCVVDIDVRFVIGTNIDAEAWVEFWPMADPTDIQYSTISGPKKFHRIYALNLAPSTWYEYIPYARDDLGNTVPGEGCTFQTGDLVIFDPELILVHNLLFVAFDDIIKTFLEMFLDIDTNVFSLAMPTQYAIMTLDNPPDFNMINNIVSLGILHEHIHDTEVNVDVVP